MQTENQAPTKTPLLPIIGLISSVLGLCICLTSPIGIILGAVGLFKNSKDKSYGGQTLSILAIVFGAFSIFTGSIMAAIAIPNFIKFQARSKQAECKTILKAAFTQEKAIFAEKNTYVPEAAFDSSRNEFGPRTRYAYFSSRDEIAFLPTTLEKSAVLAALPPNLQLGFAGTCPDCSITVACVGQVDKDPTLDVWSISTIERQSQSGAIIPPGVAHNDVNDVTERDDF